MPSFQRKYLRQTLGELHLHDTTVGNTTGACPTGVYVYAMDAGRADLALSAADAGQYERAHLRVGGADLRIASFNYGSGAYVTMQLLGSVVPSGAEYEVHELISPADKDRALSRTVGRLTARREYPLATVAGSKNYALPSDVRRVLGAHYFADPASATDRRKGHLAWFGIVPTGSGRELRIEPALPAGRQIVLDAITTLTLGPADTDTVELPAEQLALYGAEAECWNMLCKSGPGQETARYERNAARAAAAFNRQSALHAPQIDSPIKFDSPF